MARLNDRQWGLTIAAVVAILFGLLTIAAGGRALFGGPEARAAVGDAVSFVLWFNFVAGFAYVAAGVGLFQRRRWAARLSVAIFVATILVTLAFAVHVALGGLYEMRTVGAMSLRTVVWGMIAAVAMRAPMAVRPGNPQAGSATPGRSQTPNQGEIE